MKIKIRTYVFLTAVTFLAIWIFAGRYGLFASRGDWMSQHSVIPDYFRQQFYETGKLFPEFAAGLGGGQNIYYFSYYGLYSPLILPSYLMPFVKMSDYLMAVSILCILASVLLMHYWLKTRGLSAEVSLLGSVLFLLAVPMIYQAHRQVMFVDYMPFLCMAFIGVDRYWEKGKMGLYTAGVFGMVMTSFYFSIAGIFAVLLYGISRYQRTEEKSRLLRLFVPVAAAAASAGILLVPTACTLFARRGDASKEPLAFLLRPDFSVTRFAYSGYGIGLTVGILTVLFSFLFVKNKKLWFLSAGCFAVISIPVFSWLFNGGLYAREKSLIPFLPVFCYLAAEFLEQIRRKELSFQTCMAGYLLTVLWCVSAVVFRTEEFKGEYVIIFSELFLLLFAIILYRKTKLLPILLVPAFLCLTAAGVYLNGFKERQADREFYKSVTDTSWKKEISDILAQEKGLYRLEQKGGHDEKITNINRIWDTRQWITSMYSSAYQDTYKNFREHVFMTEQPLRNCLMQSASENPLFQKFMGVKYLVKKASGEYGNKGEHLTADVWEHAAPVIYATDRVISEESYQTLTFPYNQTALMQYTVAETADQSPEQKELSAAKITKSTVSLPEDTAVQKTDKGYLIRSKQKIQTAFSLLEREKDASGEQLLYIQFDVENHKKTKDVIIELEQIRNNLSAKSHIYYNGNTTFTYVTKLNQRQKEASVTFGAGDYTISNIRCFLGETSILESEDLYQSAFCPNRSLTKGNRICGEIDVKQEGYLVTSIPYDRGFEILIDGRKGKIETVNTAFLGARIAKGAHKIEIIYHAPGVLPGKLLSCMGLLLWSGAVFMERKKYAFSVSFGYNFLTFFLYNKRKAEVCDKRSIYGKHIDYRR